MDPSSIKPQKAVKMVKSVADSFAHAQSMMPESTPTKDVFPYDRDFDTFNRDDFNPQKNKNLTLDDVDRVGADLQSIKRTKMKNNYAPPVGCCILLTAILVGLGILMWFM